MLYDEFQKLNDENHGRNIKSVIGLSREKFDILAVAFSSVFQAIQKERLRSRKIKQVPSGGPKGNLDTSEKKPFLILLYRKTYPTLDMLGFLFGFSSGHAHDHLKQLMPVLLQALSGLGSLLDVCTCPSDRLHLCDRYSRHRRAADEVPSIDTVRFLRKHQHRDGLAAVHQRDVRSAAATGRQ
ncbi:MAG: transposase family protein [Candidatus Accumulibacter sp. UW25]